MKAKQKVIPQKMPLRTFFTPKSLLAVFWANIVMVLSNIMVYLLTSVFLQFKVLIDETVKGRSIQEIELLTNSLVPLLICLIICLSYLNINLIYLSFIYHFA